MPRKVPLAMSRPAWTGRATVGLFGWLMMWWLPLTRATVKPTLSRALTTFAPVRPGWYSAQGRKLPEIRRRSVSESTRPVSQPLRSAAPSRSAGQRSRPPASAPRRKQRHQGGAGRKRTRRRPHPARRRRARERHGSHTQYCILMWPKTPVPTRPPRPARTHRNPRRSAYRCTAHEKGRFRIPNRPLACDGNYGVRSPFPVTPLVRISVIAAFFQTIPRSDSLLILPSRLEVAIHQASVAICWALRGRSILG